MCAENSPHCRNIFYQYRSRSLSQHVHQLKPLATVKCSLNLAVWPISRDEHVIRFQTGNNENVHLRFKLTGKLCYVIGIPVNFSGNECRCTAKVTNHFHLVLRLNMQSVIFPCPQLPSLHYST
jgi:hypothetical protein